MSDTLELTVQLHELCELLHISTHRPRMAVKIRKARVTVEGADVDAKQATSPAWKLMPVAMATELDRCSTRVDRLLDQYTQRFRTTAPGADEDDEQTLGILIKGLYMVPRAHVEMLLRSLNEIQTEMRDCVRNWMQDSDRFREAVKAKMQDNYPIVEEYIPSLSTVLASTRIDTVTIPFGCAMSQLKQAGANAFLKEARERSVTMIEQVTHQLIAGPRQELAETLNSLTELIQANGRVSTKSIAPVRRALEKLKMFEFVADARLLEQMNSLSRTLDTVVPSEQNATTATDNGLLDALRQTAETALDEARVQEQYQVATNRLLRLRRPVVARP